VVLGEDGEPQARPMRWGLIPPWAKDAKIAYKMINARAETVDQRGAYKRLIATAERRFVSRWPTASRSHSPGCGRPGGSTASRSSRRRSSRPQRTRWSRRSTTECR